MNGKWDRIGLGLSLGLIFPILLLGAYWQLNYAYMDMDKFMGFLEQGQLHTKLISLFVIINLAIFFVFIWANLNLSARGVLYATFIYTIIIGGFKILS